MRRYVIVGAGGVGGTIGGRLFARGHEVVLVARGQHYRMLRGSGLRLGTPEGERLLAIPVVGDASKLEIHADDVLILAVKSQDTVSLLDQLAGLPVDGEVAGTRLPVVCGQNGVENERLAIRRFRYVYGMCVWLPASHLEPGVVLAYGAPLSGILDLGLYPAGVDQTAREVARDLSDSGFDAQPRQHIMRWKYAKLLHNLGNALWAICGEGERVDEVYRRAVDEGKTCLRVAGIDAATREEEVQRRGRQVRVTPVQGRKRPSNSSSQSLARRTGTIEVDYLNGEIVMLGRRYGVPTPVNEAIQRVAGASARERRSPGSVPIERLLRGIREDTVTDVGKTRPTNVRNPSAS
ncbi:MAG: ketopantoate reductase family protein [Nocardioidaceae bacterium]